MAGMEDVQVIDCPPTPDVMPLGGSPTTSAGNLVDSSSSDEVDEANENGRTSPPPKCAICLGKCRQKCYTNSCRHQFCYRCLLEWSKIKAECPLCKQPFRSILYNHKSFDQYDELPITMPPPVPPGPLLMGPAARHLLHRLDLTLSQPPRFTYSATLRVQPNQSERLQQLFLHHSNDVQRFIREYADDSIPSRQSGIEWRRYIYHRRLYARPLPDINGRFRECNAAFYSENPAQIYRLMPWFNREIVALSRYNSHTVSAFLSAIPLLLQTADIRSPQFRQRVYDECHPYTEHFIHEFLNFARSPYDMIGYDRSVQYDPYYTRSEVVISSSSDEEVDDSVLVIEPIPSTSRVIDDSSRRGRTQFTIETRSSDQTVIMTGLFGESGMSGVVSVSTSGSQMVPPSTSEPAVSSVTVTANPPPATAPNPTRLFDGDNITLSSSDSDDCQFVLAQKPPHLRTPEMVSLASDSDSDVVFVTERRGDHSTDWQPEPRCLTLRSATLANATEPPKNDDALEYNNGASTSSGGGGGALDIGSSACRTKQYAKPRLNHRYTRGIGYKSIYEAGATDIEEDSSSGTENHDEVKYNLRTKPSTTASRKRRTDKRKQHRGKESAPQPAVRNSSANSSSSESGASDNEKTSGDSSSSSSSSSTDSDDEYKAKTRKKTRRWADQPTASSKHKKKPKKSRRKSVKKRSKVKKRRTPEKATRSRRTSRRSLRRADSNPVEQYVIAERPESQAELPAGDDETAHTRKRKIKSVIFKRFYPETRAATAAAAAAAPASQLLLPTATETSVQADSETPTKRVRKTTAVCDIVPPVDDKGAEVPLKRERRRASSDTSDSDGEIPLTTLIHALRHTEQAPSEDIASFLDLLSPNNSQLPSTPASPIPQPLEASVSGRSSAVSASSSSALSSTTASTSSASSSSTSSSANLMSSSPSPLMASTEPDDSALTPGDVSTRAIPVGAEVEL